MEQKKAGIKFLIPVGVFAALVLILLGVAAATGMFGNKKKTVTNAIENTFKESLDAIGKAWQMEEYRGLMAEGEYSIDADLQIGGLVKLEMQVNANREAYGIAMDLGYFGTSLFYADLYVDEEELLMGVPYYSDYVFRVDRVSFDEDVRNMIRQGFLDEETAQTLKALNEGSRNVDLQDEELKRGMREAAAGISDVFHSLEVTSSQGKTLTVDGASRSCKGYVMTLTGERMADYFLKMKDIYEKNEAFRNYCNESAAVGAGFSSVEEFLSYYDPAELLEDSAREMREQEPVDIYFYLYKKKLAQVYAEPAEGVCFEWNFYGGNFPLENTELSFTDGTETVKFTRRGSLEGNSYQAEYELEMPDDDMIFSLEYDKNRGDFQLDAGWDDGGYLSTLLLEGEIEKTVPGKEFTISLDSLELDGDELLAGDIVISNECGEIEKPEGERLNIMKLTDEEWEEILQEIFDNM